MRNRNTVRFLGLWEHFHNPDFNYLEFEAIEREAGLNSFVLTPKRWVEQTSAKGIVTKQGRYAAKEHLPGHKIRTDFADGDPDFEKDFYIIRHTSCPAVLTENLFMDNREDVAFLESEEGSMAVVDIYIDAVLAYLEN